MVITPLTHSLAWGFFFAMIGTYVAIHRRVERRAAERRLARVVRADVDARINVTPVAEPVAEIFSDPTKNSSASSTAYRGGISVREKCLALIKAAGEEGLTTDALEVALGPPHQTISARVNELARDGLIADSGRTQITRWGKQAIVYVEATAQQRTAAYAASSKTVN